MANSGAEYLEEEQEEEEPTAAADSDSPSEYDFEAQIPEESTATPSQKKKGRHGGGAALDHGDDAASDISGMSYPEVGSDGSYIYDAQSDEECGTRGKDFAQQDANAFNAPQDGIIARVCAPSTDLIRIWLAVTPQRLFEGMACRTVEALGLDPHKGVEVMLKTDGHYTGSSRPPEVVWARQVDTEFILDEETERGSTASGDHFPLEWMIGQRIEESLHRNWPPRDRTYSDSSREAAYEEEVSTNDGASAATAVVIDGDVGGSADFHVKPSMITEIVEAAGVSAELAEYALRMSKCEGKAVMNLTDDHLRGALEIGLKADKKVDVDHLRVVFGSSVEDALLEEAVVRHPCVREAQIAYVTEEQSKCQHSRSTHNPLPPPPLPPLLSSSDDNYHHNHHGLSSSAMGTSLGFVAPFAATVASPCSSPPNSRRRTGPSWWPRNNLGDSSGDCSAARGGGDGGSSSSGGGAAAAGADEIELEDRRLWLAKAAKTNLLLRVADVIINKLRHANKYCMVCDGPIKGFLPAVPIVCPKLLCMMSSQEMGCGTDVESQISKKGDTVDLLVDVFWMAMQGARYEIGYPDTVQWESKSAFYGDDMKRNVNKVRDVLLCIPAVSDMQACIARDKSTCNFSVADQIFVKGLVGQRDQNAAHTTAQQAIAIAAAFAGTPNPTPSPPTPIATTPAPAATGVAPASAGYPTATAVLYAGHTRWLTARVRQLEVWEGEGLIAESGPARTLKEGLDARNKLAYPLLKWLLSANRAHLRPLEPEEQIAEIPCKKQFVLVTGTAERESKFQEMKRAAARASGGTGSFLAFHGSRPEHWHGILQEGLKNMSHTKHMSHAAAHGKGIYMADQLRVSLGYSSQGGLCNSHWPMARIDGTAKILAICEVVNKQPNDWLKTNRYYVVPEEDCVATRFLLVDPKLEFSRAVTANEVLASKLAARHTL